MQRIMMIALLAGVAMPVLADDMDPTNTRAEFVARKANHGHYNPAMHKSEHKKEMMKHHHHMAKKAAKPMKKAK
jgi:hypothetical protein